MPMYDRRCEECGRVELDQYEPMDAPDKECPSLECMGVLERVWLPGQVTPGVIADSIPGGVYIKHGLCHANGEPKRYDSKSEIAAEGKRRGMTNMVQHQGGKGSDKSKHTSRWI